MVFNNRRIADDSEKDRGFEGRLSKFGRQPEQGDGGLGSGKGSVGNIMKGRSISEREQAGLSIRGHKAQGQTPFRDRHSRPVGAGNNNGAHNRDNNGHPGPNLRHCR